MNLNQRKSKGLKVIFVVLIFSLLNGITQDSQAQTHHAVEKHYHHEMQSWKGSVERAQRHTNDSTIDVKFYHLNIEVAIDSSYIQGNVLCRFEPAENNLTHIFFDLNESLIVDSISYPCEDFYQQNDKIHINLSEEYNPGDIVDISIHYHGRPINPDDTKGLMYASHGNAEPVIATLSTPFLAHYWYPCKDGPEDKADSVWVDITIDKRIINGIEMMAVSNGVLTDTVSIGNKKTFRWKHSYPIVTYYVMAAISNYHTVVDTYTDDLGNILPLEYFMFDESVNNLSGIVDIPDAIEFFSSVFGEYPFFEEKFGMTELGFYGAIENQTNVIQNSLDISWFQVTVHELSHMWFADMITCETWHDGWLNEGFATYSEALWLEHTEGTDAYHNDMNTKQYFHDGTVYLDNINDPFNIFIGIIYYKGAWVLHMLRGVVGDELFFESVYNYASDPELKYGHSTTAKLQEVFESTCDMDLDFFFEQWVFDEYYPVYQYNFEQNESGRLSVSLYQAQEELYGRRPVFEMPVPLYIKFEDNSDTTVLAWNNDQFQEFEFSFNKKVEYVLVDPDRWVLREESYNPELPVGIPENKLTQKAKVFPNPFTDHLTVESLTSENNPLQFELYDITGRKIYSVKIESESTEFNLLKLKNGLYFYRILSNNGKPLQQGTAIKSQ